MAWCRAAALEHLVAFLTGAIGKETKRFEQQDRTLRAMRAAAKLMQLRNLATVANAQARCDEGGFASSGPVASKGMPMLCASSRRVLVTRPPVLCGDALLYPVDAGLVNFTLPSDTATPAAGAVPQPQEIPFDYFQGFRR